MTTIVKAILEFLPVVVFLISYKFYNMKVAVICLLLVSTICLIVTKLLKIKIQNMTLITYLIMFIFGGLTIYTDDTYFIKIKPTIINLIFSAVLIVDKFKVKNKKLVCKLIPIFNNMATVKLNKLIIFWAVFFAFCAMINEIVWRNFSEETWVYFKVFGFLTINIIFIIINFVLLKTFLKE